MAHGLKSEVFMLIQLALITNDLCFTIPDSNVMDDNVLLRLLLSSRDILSKNEYCYNYRSWYSYTVWIQIKILINSFLLKLSQVMQ